MTAKFSEARRKAFFRVLAETGNRTIAAERAKVSRSWVTLHRSTDPAFRARMEAAVAEAKARFEGFGARGEGTRRPPSGWGSLAGEELVVKGTGGAGGGKRVQIARARLKQWTPRMEARFLRTLAATCNVKVACAEVGLTPASAYLHRQRWPGFAARWEAAVDAGCMALEAALLEAAGNLLDPSGAPDAPDAAPEDEPPAPAILAMDAHQALHLLHMHRHYLPRPGRAPGRPPSAAPPGQVAASIERLLARLARRKARERERARGRAAGARDHARRPED